MTSEDISNLTNSISNLSLSKEVTESENSDDEPDNSKIISEIIYHNPGTQLWNHALVLGKTGKSTSRCITWLNLKNLEDKSLQRVNLSNIKGWKIIEEEVSVTNHSDTNIDILRAKSAEFENWQKRHVYEEVDDIGQTTVSITWVVSQKYENVDVTYKARLIA